MVARSLFLLGSGPSYLTSPRRYWKLPPLVPPHGRAALTPNGRQRAAAVAKEKDTRLLRIVNSLGSMDHVDSRRWLRVESKCNNQR